MGILEPYHGRAHNSVYGAGRLVYLAERLHDNFCIKYINLDDLLFNNKEVNKNQRSF